MISTVLAPNPGPMTLDGTNTYRIGEVVVDPGPPDHDHLDRILAGGPVPTILLTHRHLDHVEAAPLLADRTAAVIRAADPVLCRGADVLTDGAVIMTGDHEITVISTPGHTDDSICLLVRDDDEVVLLTGDTVLGRGTTVITQPDGDLAAYLGSLDRLLDVVRTRGVTTILPGHGPVVHDPHRVLTDYREHRLARLDQVRVALSAGAVTPDDVVDLVYRDLDPRLRPAALQSVHAQMAYLRGH